MESEEAQAIRWAEERELEFLREIRRDQEWQIHFEQCKNSARCGHIIALSAIVFHAVAFFGFHQRAAVWGIMVALFAYAGAWVLPLIKNRDAVRALTYTIAGLVILSWLIALGWAAHLSRGWN